MSAHLSRLDELKAHLADPACPHCRNDLQWAIEEIDHLRRYVNLLGEFAFALDALRWALENPAPGRIERRRRAYEEARKELLATPYGRPGECQGGCRRDATHVFVVEQHGRVERELCCEECGSISLAAKRATIDDGSPPAVARLEPLAPPSDDPKAVLQ